MQTLYIITGPAGVGKSTISKTIAEKSEKSVLIEGDDIYHQVIGGYTNAWLEGNHLEVFWKICLESIETYLSYGYDVIFNYIINPENLENIKNKFKDYNKKFTILITDEKTILERDALRPEDCQMKERCLVLLNNFKNKKYDKKYYLDTSNLTIDETVNTIEKSDEYNF